MIPFSSQRGLGQDLATHLMNELDNEYMEVADLRGAIAQDLHGAFAEWEAQAHALTQCTNYLFSLSINPDQPQGPLTRAQYDDYIARTEEALGLTGQPRAVIFHIKHGREHCHVVWSRIDAEAGKAVHMAFDRDKLMMVTRAFAREHGLRLPEGYERHARGKARQMSLYEMHQQRETGLTKEERIEAVTSAWQSADSAKAFMRALEERGYILATGWRDYVLVDLYGHVNALPKLIDDRSVRTRQVRAFLDKDYPVESLPSVEEAKGLAAQHRQAIEEAGAREQTAGRREELKELQARRRAKLEKEAKALKIRQAEERVASETAMRQARDAIKRAHLDVLRRMRTERYERRATGLAGFLGRVSGIELVRRKWHRHQDRKRNAAYLAERDALRERQREARLALQRKHEMQGLDLRRKITALDRTEARELASLEQAGRAEARARHRAGHAHMPALKLELGPRGRKAVPHKAARRYTSELAQADVLPVGPALIMRVLGFHSVSAISMVAGERRSWSGVRSRSPAGRSRMA